MTNLLKFEQFLDLIAGTSSLKRQLDESVSSRDNLLERNMHETTEQKRALLAELVSPGLFYQDHVSTAIEMAARAKVGCEIYSVARLLLQVMEAIDGQRIGTGTTDLIFHIERLNSRLGPDGFYAPDFYLSDMEDLYYAVCGKTKDLRQCAEIHSKHGFTKPEEAYMHFSDFGASTAGSVSLKDFLSTLIATEAALYGGEILEPLNRAILRKNMLLALEGEKDPLTSGSALEAPGLQDMREKNCAMILAALSEKRRSIEAAERAQEEKMRRLHRVQYYRGQALLKLCGGSDPGDNLRLPGGNGTYQNLHDLTNRINKLEDSKPLEYPCLCDPDCLCAPLCAGEPEENCLCETYPLFWRVTSGFEIDELLYRAKDELYPFKTRYNRLAQLTLGGLD